eukprot:m51a1_g12082 hypothetical protein (72) ;mRNA; f:3055-3531
MFDLNMSPEVNEWDKYHNEHGPKALPFTCYINKDVHKLEYDEEGLFEVVDLLNRWRLSVSLRVQVDYELLL